MKTRVLALSLAAVLTSLFLTGCETVVVTTGGPQPPSYGPGPGEGLHASVEPGAVRVTSMGQTVSVCRAGRPVVDRWKWVHGRSQIAVRSHGYRGPGIVELFDTRSGTLVDKVFVGQLEHGNGPGWAMSLLY